MPRTQLPVIIDLPELATTMVQPTRQSIYLYGSPKPLQVAQHRGLSAFLTRCLRMHTNAAEVIMLDQLVVRFRFFFHD